MPAGTLKRNIIVSLIMVSLSLFFSCKKEEADRIPAVTADTQIYIVGGGLAGMSAAMYAIQDGKIPGKNIHIFEEFKGMGGALDSKGGTKGKPYAARGARLVNHRAHKAYFEFLKRIPSLADQKEMEKIGKKSETPAYKVKNNLYDELLTFTMAHKLNAVTRLVGKDQRRINHMDYHVSFRQKYDLLNMLLSSEEKLQGKRIDEFFDPTFFKTNLWHMFSSVFGFDKWHSLIEMRRYVRNYLDDVDSIGDLEKAGWNTPYNTFESVVVPTLRWLDRQGVNFHMGCKVTGLDFKPGNEDKTVEKLHYVRDGKNEEIVVRNNDFVLVSIGSKTSDSTEGDMKRAPATRRGKVDGAWMLWEAMAKRFPGDFGNPLFFTGDIDHSKFMVFNITTKGPLLKDLIMKFTKNKRFGEQHMTIFTESAWNLIMHFPWQPFVRNQDKDTTIFMAYALYGDNRGDYVKKPMGECNGDELITEMCYHFGFMKELPEIKKVTTCVPYMLPYVTSMFLPRKIADRPPVIPRGSTNLGLIGEYTEMPEESVFMVSYSCKSAQTAVYKLLKVNKEVTPHEDDVHNPITWAKLFYYL
jgi:oleate hydratase